jgi:site-specific DNA-methyltransferase (adenine-specific)
VENESDIRSTPDEVFKEWDDIFNFQLDVCANKENAKVCRYLTIKDNGLEKPWLKRNWMNPPYSKGSIEKWLKKTLTEQEKGNTTVALLPGDTSTKWYHTFITKNHLATPLPLTKRVKFNGIESGAKFASHIVIFWGKANFRN